MVWFEGGGHGYFKEHQLQKLEGQAIAGGGGTYGLALA